MRKLNSTSYSKVTVGEINERASENPADFVAQSEKFYSEQLEEVAKIIKSSNGSYKMILLCGPSSSGKTTSAHKLVGKLNEIGVKSSVVSMDNFFLGIANYNLRPDGKPDMESIETLDTEYMNQCLKELLDKGESDFPVFDFKSQQRITGAEKISVSEGEIIVMEGIHALNPLIIKGIPTDKIFRMYVSVRTKFVDEQGDDVLRPSEIRLVRRMIRDTLFRGYPIKETIEYWNYVLESERKYIDPFRDDVDFKMDTTIDYEVCTWHRLLHDILAEGDWEEFKKYSFMNNILSGLMKFSELSTDLIKKDSLLREFIG